MGNAQEIVDSVESIKYPKKKLKKKHELEEKDYIKKLCLEEKKEKPTITSIELSTKLGVTKEVVEKVFEEEIKESKKLDEEKKIVKPKKERKFFKKIFESLKKIFDDEDKKAVKEIIIYVILYGLPLNFVLFAVFGIIFNLYSWVGWGMALWFIERKCVDIIRGIWIK